MVNREMQLLNFGDVVGRDLDRDVGQWREIAAGFSGERDCSSATF